MPRAKEEKKAEIKLAIDRHLSLNGPTGWPELMAQFSGVSRATFFRYIKEVREERENAASAGTTGELKMMQKRIRSQIRTPEQAQKKLVAQMPAAPSPAALVGMGDAMDVVFNFLGAFNQLVADAQMMRSEAVTVREDGTEKLRNPMMFDRSMGRRLELMETWLRSQDMVWNLEKMRELHMIIVEEVGKADPDAQQAIIARIRGLNNRIGMTVDARVR